MDSHRDGYTINPETGRKIKIGTQTWKRFAAKYYMIDGIFMDQLIPDSRAYVTNKVWKENTGPMKAARKSKHATPRKRVGDPKGEKYYYIVGSKAWNERYLESEWNGQEFGDKRRQSLPEFMDMVKKRREVRRYKFFTMFDRKVSEGRLSDVIQFSPGYALIYYNTIDGNMYKEWMNEKRTKKDFHIHKDDDKRRIWVHLLDGKNEEEVEPLNLMIDETGEFSEKAKKYILSGMRDYPQCFITIMAYNLI